METEIKEFNNIWLNYMNIIPCNTHEFDKYMKIINKIRNNNIEFVEDKDIFIKLLEDISLVIYYYKRYDEEYVDYDEDNLYNDGELTCCYKIKKYLLC